MSIVHSNRWWRAGAICGLAGVALAAAAQQEFPEIAPRSVYVELPPERLDYWQRHFRLGVLVGVNIKAEFRMSGDFDVSGSAPGPAGVSGVDHIYDDGYVLVDETGNAGGLTSYWGYNDPSQYDPVSQTLTFTSARSFSATGSSEQDDPPHVGFDLAYGANLWHWKSKLFGWEFGFGLLPIGIEDNSTLSAQTVRTVHQFNVGDIELPTAPYEGGPSGVGPLIEDVATALPDGNVAGSVTGTRELDAMLYVARLGPTLHWEFAPRWALTVGLGPAVGFVDGELEFDEQILSSVGGSGRNRGRDSESELVYGGYINATVLYHAVPNGDFYLGAQYMPLSSATIRGGGREARLDLSGGVYFTFGINWPF